MEIQNGTFEHSPEGVRHRGGQQLRARQQIWKLRSERTLATDVAAVALMRAQREARHLQQHQEEV